MMFLGKLLSMMIVLIMMFVSSTKSSNREKRFVVFPRGGSFKIVIGIGLPIKLGSRQSMSIGWNLQMQYALPTNITNLEQYPPDYDRSSRKDRSLAESERSVFYRGLEDALNGAGLDGRDCILRSICDNASDNLDHGMNGLYGLLFHIIFTPTYGNPDEDTILDPIYVDAQKAGEYGVECHTLYTKCALDEGLLGLFSVLDHEFG